MLIILEIAMLIGGIYALFSAKVPAFLVGGGKYEVEGNTARAFGLLLILPLPLALLSGFLLGFLFGEDGIGYATIVEFIIVFGIAILSSILIRMVGQKVTFVDEVETTISKKSQGALMYAIFSFTGFAAIICCPLAIIYANQALKLIEENHTGEQYRQKAKTARVIAIVATALWGSALICFVTIALTA